jgi:uncharacterized membrane protein
MWLPQGLLAAFLTLLAVGVGLALCIVPGVIFYLMFWPALFLIVDRGENGVDALKHSVRITEGNKASLFLVVILEAIIGLVGACACYVGLVFALPFIALLNAVIYLAMTGQPILGDTPQPR